MSNHDAKIVKLKNVRPHSNADRLQLATADGNQIIVGTEQKEGDVGVYFPVDSALSLEFLSANDLVAVHDPETGKKVSGGYFGASGRVKAQRLRGEKSEGFWTTLDALENFLEYCNTETSHDLDDVGFTFDELGGKKVCEKYITPATRKAMKDGSTLKAHPNFHRHTDTAHLKRNMRDIPNGARLFITTKLHGTSQRLGYLPVDVKAPFWKRMLGIRTVKEHKHIIGSRNQVRGYGEDFKGEKYRYDVVESLIDNLHKGETLYFEVVGYEHTGKPIMPSVSTKAFDKKHQKQYGDKVHFSYGCEPMVSSHYDHSDESEDHFPQNEMYVYRITQQNEDGNVLELSWDQLYNRCSELGIKTVPLLDGILFFGEYPISDIIVNADTLLDLATKYAEDEEEWEGHIREGVCIRWEHNGEMGILKHKNWLFLLAEGHLKDSSDYVDKEDIS